MNKAKISVKNKVINSSSLEEIFSKYKEKIFIEPIDRYCEEESDKNYDSEINESYDIEEDFNKFDELYLSLHLFDDNDISTEIDSEESIPTIKPVNKKFKKLLINDILYVNKDNINQTKINVINKYYWLLKKKKINGFC